MLHSRPRSWPVVAAHLAAGFLAARGWSGPGDSQWLSLATAAGLWTIGLNGGTLALNGAIDRDDDDVGYLDRPPAPPRGLAPVAILWMLAGLAGALWMQRAGLWGAPFSALYAFCLLLSILYSVPPMRLKARAGYDLVVNCLGYGGGTFAAGWAASGVPLRVPVALAAAAFCFLFAGLYPLTQIYQIETDAAQGIRTLAVRLGRRGSLWLALVSVLAAFILLAAGAVTLGLAGDSGSLWWRGALLLLPAAFWLRILVPHIKNGGESCGKQEMYTGLVAWGLTDVAAIMALGL